MASIGIIVNPVAGSDIRRLTTAASAQTRAAKVAAIRQLAAAAAGFGATRFFCAAGATTICRVVETLDVPVEHWPGCQRGDRRDTAAAAAWMAGAGCDVVTILGGDGTLADVTRGWPDALLIALPFGTNNAYGHAFNPTSVGIAAAFVAASEVPAEAVSRRSKIVHVVNGDAGDESGVDDIAMIDAALVQCPIVGSGQIVDTSAIRHLVLSRAEPTSVGLSAIGGVLLPCTASDTFGLYLRFDSSADKSVRAPVGHGQVAILRVIEARKIDIGERLVLPAAGTVIAFDGERRRIATGEVEMYVDQDGPRLVDVPAALRLAVSSSFFRPQAEVSRGGAHA